MNILKALAVFVIFGCSPSSHSQNPSLPAWKKIVLKEDGPEEVFYWEIINTKDLWGVDLNQVLALDEYKDSLLRVLGKNLFEACVKKEASQDLSRELLTKAEYGDKRNALYVHTGSWGKIRKINYLEAQILNYQIKQFPLLGHPTEFHAFIAFHEGEGESGSILLAVIPPGHQNQPSLLKRWKLKFRKDGH